MTAAEAGSRVEEDLAQWVGSAIDVGADDEEIVRAVLLDSVAVMGTGIRARASAALARAASAVAPGRCPIVGTRETAAPAAAALRNGTAGAAELWDDTSVWMNTHSSVPILAALISAADDVQPTLGEVIEAYVAGLEAQLAVRRMTGHSLYLRGYHSTGLLGVFGTAVAVGHLRGYSPDLMAMVIGISASAGAGVRAQFGSDMMALHSGLAAERGIAVADLAAAGVVPDLRAVTGRFGFVECFSDAPEIPPSWPGPMGLAAAQIMLKRFPVGAPNVAPVDAALRVRDEVGGDLGRIRSIRCRADRWIEYTIGLDVPPAPFAGRVNLPYCVIAALQHGPSLAAAFVDENPVPEEVRHLIERFSVETADLRDESGHRFAEVEVLTDDGRRLSARSSPSAYILPALHGPSGTVIREKVRNVPAFSHSAATIIDILANAPGSVPFADLLAALRPPA